MFELPGSLSSLSVFDLLRQAFLRMMMKRRTSMKMLDTKTTMPITSSKPMFQEVETNSLRTSARSSHIDPLKPSEQLHLKEPYVFWHWPPLVQGFLMHSSTSLRHLQEILLFSEVCAGRQNAVYNSRCKITDLLNWRKLHTCLLGSPLHTHTLDHPDCRYTFHCFYRGCLCSTVLTGTCTHNKITQLTHLKCTIIQFPQWFLHAETCYQEDAKRVFLSEVKVEELPTNFTNLINSTIYIEATFTALKQVVCLLLSLVRLMKYLCTYSAQMFFF